MLREVVASIGTHNWSEVARQFMEVARERGVCKAERNGKSCRIRWSNQLDTGLDFTPFTKQEERVIIQVSGDGTRPSLQSYSGASRRRGLDHHDNA